MNITYFTIMRDSRYVGSAAVMEQSVNAVKSRATCTGRPVSLTVHINDGRVWDVVYYPDSTVERLWDIATELQNLRQGGGTSK